MKQDDDKFYEPQDDTEKDEVEEYEEDDEYQIVDDEIEIENQKETSAESGRKKRKSGGRTSAKSTPSRRPSSGKANTHRDSSGAGRKKRKPSSGKSAKGMNGHAIFFVVIAVVLVFTIVRLFVWNIGKHSGYDPNESTTEFDTEKLDYIISLSPSQLKDHVDDGVTSVLALGNDPFSDDRGETGLAALMEKKTGFQITNCAFPGSTIAMKNREFDTAYPMDALSLYLVTASFCNANFDLMDNVVGNLGDEAAKAALEDLKKVDFSKIDMITILYDLQDYMGKRIVYDENNLKNLNTYYGALNASIQLIQETWPHIRIVVLSHPYGFFTDGDGTVKDGDMDDLGNGTLTDYLKWALEVCRGNGVTFIDNYYGSVTVEDKDCLTDGYHLNEKGRKRIAERFAEILIEKDKE